MIDPIDGTKDFVRGVACWATLLAVMEDNIPIIGIAYYPTSKNLFVAEKAKGTLLNDKRTHVSANTDINLAYINHSAPNHFEEKGKTETFLELCRIIQAPHNLSNHGLELVLQGKIDATISGKGEIHDFAAPAILVEEAGGKFSDFSGDYKFDSNCAIFSNGHLHEDILKIFNS